MFELKRVRKGVHEVCMGEGKPSLYIMRRYGSWAIYEDGGTGYRLKFDDVFERIKDAREYIKESV